MATTPVFLPGKTRGQRSMEGYDPWDRKELDMTEVAEHTRTSELQAKDCCCRHVENCPIGSKWEGLHGCEVGLEGEVKEFANRGHPMNKGRARLALKFGMAEAQNAFALVPEMRQRVSEGMMTEKQECCASMKAMGEFMGFLYLY